MKFGFSLSVLLALLAGPASAEPETNLETSFIGIYAEQTGAICNLDVPLYTDCRMHIYAYLQPGEMGGDAITAADFRVENLPVPGSGGIATQFWTTDWEIGDPWGGLVLGWDQNQPGPWVLFGMVELFALQSDWICQDTELKVLEDPGMPNQGPVLVDALFVAHDVLGTRFWLNCVMADCQCDQPSDLTLTPEIEEGAAALLVELHQNQPNPFNPNTEIRFYLPNPSYVFLRVFDVRGQLVATLLDGEVQAGHHSLQWNGKDSSGQRSPSGVYFLRMQTDTEALSIKMALLK